MADFWTDVREDQLINLFTEHPCLYDISLKAYSNKIDKSAALRDIAQRLGVSEKEVNKKLHSLRTQYNRYTKLSPSGSAGEKKTPRQEWILRRLIFLEPHVKKRASTSNMNDKDDDAAAANKENEHQQDEMEDEEEESSEISRSAYAQQNVSQKKRKSDTEKEENDILNAVGCYLKQKSEKVTDDIAVFCKNLEHKIRRIKNENIRLELEHQLEDACYHAIKQDQATQNPTLTPSPPTSYSTPHPPPSPSYAQLHPPSFQYYSY